MDAQSLFNIAVALVGGLGGWILNSISNNLKEMRDSEHSLRNKVQTIEVTLAGRYVSKDDLDRMMTAIFVKLDKIDAKLDTKQDKP